MRNKYTQPLTGLKLLSLLLFVAFVLPQSAISQIYKHDFGTTTISAHPYNVAPTVINTNLSASSWTNSTGSWSSNTGATGQAIQLSTPAGTSTINLTFTIAPGFAADITSFDFWSRRSGSGPPNWQLAINGITVGNGTTSTAGATLGSTPVSTPITALTGTVSVTLTVSNATGGNARLDDFTLNGSVYSNCNTVAVTSFTPATGPENTQVNIIGSGFNNAATVKFDGITATFTVVSNTEIKAIVPAGITTGIPAVQATDGCQSIADSGFTVFESECSGPGTEIFISELYDQSPGSGGMVELYNPTNNTITFNGVYTMLRYGDITDATPGYTLTLTGSIAAHSTYLINCGPPLQTHCVTPSSSILLGAGFNEDDKIELVKNSVVIDRAYTQNNIPALSTLNAGFTMIRKPNITGPTPTYNYTDWNITDNPAFNGTINNYCADLGMHTINTVPVPAITQPQNQNVCEGGTATFTTAVATGPGYTYQWKMLANGGTTWNNVTNGANYSGATTATLTITNTPAAFNGNQYYCVITSASCDINSNAALLTVGGVLAAPQATVTDATCAALGQAVVTSPLGSGLTYNLNGGTYQSSVTFSNLAAGNYSIIAKDAAGCTSAPFNFTIQAGAGTPTAPIIGTTTQPTCATSTGSITITSPTGTGITYSIDGTNYQADTSFTLTPGTYSVTAKNAGGCVSPATLVTINPAPSAPTAPVIGTTTQPTCATPTGSITITAPTGTGITYSIDGTNYQAGITFNLTPGTYSVTAKNAAGCVSPATSVSINPAPSAPTAPVIGTTTQPTCATPTGSITITAPTGTGITYSIDGTNYQAGTTFNLTPGTYSVTAKNAAGCVSPATSVNINPAPSAPTAPVIGTTTQPTCSTPTGSIIITTPTGTGITYSIDGVNYQAGTTFNLTPGTYSVTAKNAAGCVSPATSVTINPAPSAPTAPVFGTPTQPTCATPTGSITITAPVGTGITYSIDGTNYQAGTTFTLNSGTYSVTAKNAAGCLSTATSVTINPAPAGPAVANVTVTQPDCNSATGSITVNTPTGTVYQYSLNGGIYQTQVAFTGLNPGSYTITTQNADGCTSVTAPITINSAQPVLPPPNLAVMQTDCNTALGSISVTSPLGAGYTYSIDGTNYGPATLFPNLSPGTYSITVKNASGCISLATVKLITPQPATPAAPGATITQQPTCNLPTGNITVTPPSAGVFMYSVNGTAYQNSNIFTGLLPGTYNITVRNTSGCVSPAVVRVINAAPNGPTAPSIIAESPADCSESTGTLTILAPTGTGLTYSIDGINYQTGTVFAGLPAGSYPVTVKNTAGCTSVANIKIIDGSKGAPVAPTLSDIQPDCTQPLGSITVTSPTGTGLSYSIDGGLSYQTGVTFASLEPGSYSILVKNAAGCVSTATNQVISTFAGAPTKPVVTPTQPDCTTATGSFTITSPVASDITYSVNGAPYQAATSYTTLAPGTYTVIAKNGAGCISLTTTVVINPAPTQPAVPTVTTVQPTCSTPSGKITVVNPVGPNFDYSIDGGTSYQTSPIFDGLGGGTYYITVQNAAGCKATSTFILIDAPPAPAPSPGTITGNNQVCMGDTVALTESVTGGVWSSSNDAIATVDATGVVTPVQAGTVQIVYTVGTVCTDSALHTVTVYSLPQLNLNDIWLCEDPATGQIIAPKIVTTGLPDTDYNFVWSKGGTVLPDTTSTLEVDETGTYTVTATNILSGCSNSATVTVGVSSLALVDVVVGTDFTNSQTITVTVTGGSGDYEYSLSGMPYQDEPVFSGVTAGEYTLRVRDKHGCGFVKLTVFAIDYPRFFTPNGDGANDTWNIKDLASQRDAVILIFDRFGKIITSVYPSGRGWDGTLNGSPLPATDYWFALSYTTSSGDKKEFRAHFSLLR